MLAKLLRSVAFFFLVSICSAQSNSAAPAIFFTDLTSGPNTGGENSKGAFVTLYGNNFGTAQGSSTVSLNGATGALTVISWGTTWNWYQKIVVQLNTTATSGNFVVTTSAGSSNTSPFTVRSGNIYCISTSGNDSNNGKFPSSCWSTMAHASAAMAAGDTVYLLNGVMNTTTSKFSAVVNIEGSPGGTASSPIAFVAYPGATATIGNVNSSIYAIRVPQTGVSPAYYVIAGLTLRGQSALELYQANQWRIIGNDLSCSTGGGYGCAHVGNSNNVYMYGNNVHNIVGKVKLYHAVYLTTNTNHVWIGWNIVDPDPNHTGSAGCRGVQFYSTGGSDQYDLHVHDNIIRNTPCDGLNFNTVNPNSGTVEAYNNLIYNAGTSDPGDFAHYTCLYVNSGGTSPTVPAQMYNNTMYNCGPRGGGSNVGAISALIPTQFRNNLVYSTGTAEPYFASDSGACSRMTGSNNLWYGAGAAPCASNLTGNLNVNPLFVTAGTNFALQSTSPAKDAGVAVSGLGRDMTGRPRPQGSAYDIGAYEFASGGGTVPTANCDLNSDGAVNDADVTIAVNQALGSAGSSNLDLTGDTVWNVVDVQRVINARNGSGCRVGL